MVIYDFSVIHYYTYNRGKLQFLLIIKRDYFLCKDIVVIPEPGAPEEDGRIHGRKLYGLWCNDGNDRSGGFKVLGMGAGIFVAGAGASDMN